jgi:hypothetical protein
MRRRDLLRLGATLPAALASRRARAQTNIITRAAVVIGVDRPRDLSPLHAAVSGAKQVGDWLESEGINVKRFIDDVKPVKAEDIFDAIDGYVSLGTLQQLIVYFCWAWLLCWNGGVLAPLASPPQLEPGCQRYSMHSILAAVRHTKCGFDFRCVPLHVCEPRHPIIDRLQHLSGHKQS